MAPRNLSTILLARHAVAGELRPGSEVGLVADQALLTDVLGTLVMIELEAMGVDRVRIPLAAQYVDHNLLEVDNLNAEEHLFLQTACQRLGIWYAGAGTGISHPVHMQYFGRRGAMLVGCDSHTCAAGSLGMLAIGMGGIDLALAMMGEPVFIPVPKIWSIRLSGTLPDWVSSKDVVLELLRRHGVEGASGRVIEFYGPGLDCLSAMDRHVIANMGAEMGATTTVFPSDQRTRQFLASVGRADQWVELAADPSARYDHHDEVRLADLEPLIATPSSPGNVVRVRDAGAVEIYQSYIGSSANPGYRDLAMAAAIVSDRRVHSRVSFDINPSSREILQQIMAEGSLAKLVAAGGRLHQPGCNGCIGMGQAPAKGRPSLRTVPRNFPGRSGTLEDSIYLCSPETATASALTGVITDPRDLGIDHPRIEEPVTLYTDRSILVVPLDPREAREIEISRTPNIARLPRLPPVAGDLRIPVLLKVGDDISTDAIVPAGNEVMPHWTNFERVATYTFRDVDRSYPERAARTHGGGTGHAIIGGGNYGQGSSRENAALIPRLMGLSLVIAKSIARIHRQNLVNFGVVPVTFIDRADYDQLEVGDEIWVEDIIGALRAGPQIEAWVGTLHRRRVSLAHTLSPRQVDLLAHGGSIGIFLAGSKFA